MITKEMIRKGFENNIILIGCTNMSNLIRTAVLDRRTKENISIDFGDFVVCCNCGRTMLVNIGTERCPICDEKALTWEDKENEEVSYEYFYNNNDYILVDTEC